MNKRNVIFDLGGIFLSLDYCRTKQAFLGIGAENFYDYFAEANLTGLLRDFEVGKVSAALFRREVRQRFSLIDVSDSEFDHAWNAMLLDVIPERIETLFSLKNRHRLFLFSNINEIHEQGVRELFRDSLQYERFLAVFDRVYYSHRVGFRKPNQESFERIIIENDLLPHETLFIDDMNTNVIGAENAGINAHQLLPHDCLLSALQKYGYLPSQLH